MTEISSAHFHLSTVTRRWKEKQWRNDNHFL